MVLKKRLLLLALLVPAASLSADWTAKDYFWLVATSAGLGGFGYTWLAKKSLEKKYDTHRKRFKNHEFLTDCYEDALNALADYKEYVELLDEASEGNQAKELCKYLTDQFSQNTQLIPPFKAEVLDQKLELELKKKKIDRALVNWQESKKKALLAQQGPLLLKTYSSILSTLDTLATHVPYVEAHLFMQDHNDSLKEERALNLSDSAQLSHQLDTLIRAKSHVGERYPYRVYTNWVERYHKYLQSLKKELDHKTFKAFQKPSIDYITSTYTILDTLKKHLKSSKEFKSECMQYKAEMIAQAREKENQQLKRQLAQMQGELAAMKDHAPQENNNAIHHGPHQLPAHP